MNKLYTKAIALNKDGQDDGVFVSYDWIMSTLLLNSYSYSMSLEALKSFRKGLNAKPAPVITDHEDKVNNIIGRVGSARIRGNSELIGRIMLQKDLTDVNSNAIIDRINAGTLTDGSIRLNWNDAYFKCDRCDSVMKMHRGFMSCEKGHFLGELDSKGQKMTAVLYGNPTVYEFSLVVAGADPGAEKANDLYKVMEDNNLSIGALEVAAQLQNLHFGKLCQTLGIDPNRTPQPKRTSRNFQFVAAERLELERERKQF